MTIMDGLFASVEFTGICDHCGEVSMNELLFNINHHPMGNTGLCTTQALVEAHLYYAIRQGHDPSREIARAREVRLNPDSIIAAAQAEMPSLCVACRHNPKTHGDYCLSDPCQKAAAT